MGLLNRLWIPQGRLRCSAEQLLHEPAHLSVTHALYVHAAHSSLRIMFSLSNRGLGDPITKAWRAKRKREILRLAAWAVAARHHVQNEAAPVSDFRESFGVESDSERDLAEFVRQADVAGDQFRISRVSLQGMLKAGGHPIPGGKYLDLPVIASWSHCLASGLTLATDYVAGMSALREDPAEAGELLRFVRPPRALLDRG